MNASARVPLEVERLLSENQRRPIGLERMEFEAERRVTIAEVESFRAAIATKPPGDEIEELLGELRNIQPEKP